MNTLRELKNKGIQLLEDAGIEDAEFDALQLLLSVTELSEAEYLLRCDDKPSALQEERYFECLQRRASNYPLQYIIGSWTFYNSEFFVGDGVLIPRPETEELVECCISIIKKNNYKVVYDLCTGSGCIGLSIAAECPSVRCYLFDYYDAALKYAAKNLTASGLDNVMLIKTDVLKEYKDEIPYADLIVSNPPYIASDELPALQKEVQMEPASALDGGADGLLFYRAIAEFWLSRLNDGGCAAVECGEGQCEDIISLFGNRLNSEAKKDLYGTDRFVIGFDKNGGF